MFSRISSRLIRPAQTQLVRVPKRFESVPAAAAAAAQQSNAPAFESSSVHHVTVLRSSLSVAADEPTLHPRHWSDADVQKAVESGSLKFFDLENQLGDFERAVRLRRKVVESRTTRSLDMLPYQHYDYAKVHGQCAENVIGYVPIPVGVAGPLVVDGVEYHIPLATTEGALVASTTRGCKAISMSGGARTEVLNDGISRAPVLRVPSIKVASQIRTFVEQNFDEVANVFNSTSRFARLLDIKTFIAGRLVYLRFRCSTGDAMGMNMVSKGVDKCLEMLSGKFPLEVLGLSGNVCTDKKPSAINWIEGRGKSVCAEAIIKADVVRDVLKTSADALVTLNHAKNLVGSAVAGSIGGNNAHAANLVTAAFLATGQDPAQNVESSNCLTIIEKMDNGDVYFSVNMPCLEVGTVGGGTILPGQAACLEMLGVKGSNAETPGKNAQQLARIIASTVMAGELSLMSAISAGHLIKSHLKLNRKPGAANGVHHANGTATNGAAKAANGANGAHRTNGAH